MTRYRLFFIVAGILLAISVLTYGIHYAAFRDTHHIFIFMVGDLGFLPLEVLLVIIVFERVLARHERHGLLQRLNVVIGSFFSEVGTHLLGELVRCFGNGDEIRDHLAVTGEWSDGEFRKAMTYARRVTGGADCHNIDLEELRRFLIQKKAFLLALMQNPNLLEHERFTDLLLALFHLTEELEARGSLQDLAEGDLQHLSGDIQRVFGLLAAEWVAYLEHLKTEYPFLFSLVVRTHPLQACPSPTVA